MPFLLQETKEQVIRLLGYPDYETVTQDNIAELDLDYSQANFDRILEIVEAITKKPEIDANTGCVCGGGIDYQLDNAFSDSSLSAMDKFTFDFNGFIKRLKYNGKRLTSELSGIVRLPIYNDRYGASMSKPVAFVSYPN